MSTARVGILAIGDELLDGRVVDSNSSNFAKRLLAAGVHVVRTVVVGDPLEDIQRSLRFLLQESDFVLCSGGLGPTADDRTRQAIAEFLGVELVEDAGSWQAIRERFERMGREPSASNRVQALHPRGSKVLPNPIGTAPGFVACDGAGKRIAAIPGVPSEALRILEDSILPLVAGKAPTAQGTLLFAGLAESRLGEILAKELEEGGEIRVGITASWSFLKVTVRAPSPERLAQELLRIRHEAEEWYVGEGGHEVEDLLVARLRASQTRVSLAESCTAGLVAARLGSVPGVSEVFHESFVTYANEAKTRWLGVPEQLLVEHGAVSEPCVRAMLQGLEKATGAALCGVVSGVAGPGGGSPQKPVGLVYLAASHAGQVHVLERRYGDPGRQVVRGRAASDLLLLMLRALDGRAHRR